MLEGLAPLCNSQHSTLCLAVCVLALSDTVPRLQSASHCCAGQSSLVESYLWDWASDSRCSGTRKHQRLNRKDCPLQLDVSWQVAYVRACPRAGEPVSRGLMQVRDASLHHNIDILMQLQQLHNIRASDAEA